MERVSDESHMDYAVITHAGAPNVASGSYKSPLRSSHTPGGCFICCQTLGCPTVPKYHSSVQINMKSESIWTLDLGPVICSVCFCKIKCPLKKDSDTFLSKIQGSCYSMRSVRIGESMIGPFSY